MTYICHVCAGIGVTGNVSPHVGAGNGSWCLGRTVNVLNW